MFTGLTVPATASSGPAEPMPAPDTSLPPIASVTTAARAAQTASASPAGVGRVTSAPMVPSGWTGAAASLVPPTSTARTPVSAAGFGRAPAGAASTYVCQGRSSSTSTPYGPSVTSS